MDNSAIQTLEAAAQMLMAPPQMVTSEQRHQAESVFLEFRSTKNPYQLCREILEKSTSDYVLFEAAGLLKAALIREWTLLSDSDVCSLREYLLNYLLRKEAPPFLREKLLQTIAIIIKRGSIDDGGRERKNLIAELEKIILSSPISQQKLACSLILAIMQEFAITVKSADVGLIWEVHFRLKKSFEALDLKRIFRFTVGVLEQIVRSGHRPEGEQALLTKQLLTIVETVLCWSHVSPLLSKRLIGAFEAIYESDTAPALRLSLSWRDTIMQPELLALFFEIHMYVRSNPDLASPSLTCLVQLASLSGVVVSASNLKQQYLENYVNSFLNMMAYIQPVEREMLGISDIYRRLIQFFAPTMIAATPPAFLQNLTNLTCHCIRGSVIEEGVNDDTVWRESLNKFLHSWSSLVHESDGYSNETLMNPCIEVFNTYLQSRLAPPDGTRLESQLQLMHMGKLPISGGGHLVTLFEDLHWILMITGHFLAVDCTEGETVMIPSEIIHFSLRENANIDASLRYLVGETTNTENVDSVLKLIGEIMRINAWECAALEAGLGSVFSPELSATISWLLKIWANSYLMPQASVYSELTNLPIDDFNMVVTALRVGLTAVSCDVSTLCCDTIVGLSNKVRTLGDDNPYALSLLTLAELLLMLIIKVEIPPDSIPAAGAAIYSLTCVKPALLEGLARQLIEAYAVNDPTNVPRLEEAFGVLTNGVLFDGLRTHKLRFQDNFDKFLASVHGFLIVK
ncbi:hypothetical protein HF086_001788 [Spodoptera exigua]|uniref:Exportin-4 n=1 Tax=Spodoptera exigua TaxID=7107 RepID=A0A922MFM2_SPOEX|nr:hypothetical protein HF086_001788 [Spodoptera exigua]